MKQPWTLQVISKDADGVHVTTENGDTQWLTWAAWKELRKNRRENFGTDE
jgi:hypothetical protein